MSRSKKKRKKGVGFSDYHGVSSTYIPASGAKKIVLISIVVMMILVVFGLLFLFFFTPEKRVEMKVQEMAKDYYENYFYERMVNSPKYQAIEDLDAAMEKYHTEGLQTMTLRDLLLYDDKKNYENRDFLVRYCDEDETKIRIFMDSPYDRTSYHVEYTYSCNY